MFDFTISPILKTLINSDASFSSEHSGNLEGQAILCNICLIFKTSNLTQ